jgi:hypothetical protein
MAEALWSGASEKDIRAEKPCVKKEREEDMTTVA